MYQLPYGSGFNEVVWPKLSRVFEGYFTDGNYLKHLTTGMVLKSFLDLLLACGNAKS